MTNKLLKTLLVFLLALATVSPNTSQVKKVSALGNDNEECEVNQYYDGTRCVFYNEEDAKRYEDSDSDGDIIGDYSWVLDIESGYNKEVIKPAPKEDKVDPSTEDPKKAEAEAKAQAEAEAKYAKMLQDGTGRGSKSLEVKATETKEDKVDPPTEDPKKAEAERLAKEAAEKAAKEKAEVERLAKEEAERLEQERLAKQEAERLAKEAAEKEKAEQERLKAIKEAEEKAKEEALKAKQEAERLEKEKQDQEKEEIRKQIANNSITTTLEEAYNHSTPANQKKKVSINDVDVYASYSGAESELYYNIAREAEELVYQKLNEMRKDLGKNELAKVELGSQNWSQIMMTTGLYEHAYLYDKEYGLPGLGLLKKTTTTFQGSEKTDTKAIFIIQVQRTLLYHKLIVH